MEEFMKDNGTKDSCMEREYIHGQKVNRMRDNISTTKKMVLEVIDGTMVNVTLEIGKITNAMAKDL